MPPWLTQISQYPRDVQYIRAILWRSFGTSRAVETDLQQHDNWTQQFFWVDALTDQFPGEEMWPASTRATYFYGTYSGLEMTRSSPQFPSCRPVDWLGAWFTEEVYQNLQVHIWDSPVWPEELKHD